MKGHFETIVSDKLLALSKSIQQNYNGRYKEYCCQRVQKSSVFILRQIALVQLRQLLQQLL